MTDPNIVATYAILTRLTNRALKKAKKLPEGPYRDHVIDTLRASISWITQAHDAYLQIEAEKNG